jgi:RNA polymerase sigma-70 factor, ECF subfamily
VIVAVAEGVGRAESVERSAPDVALEGASEAARELYERHGGPVLRFCRSRLRSREEAEDARQTVFLYAFRALRAGVIPISELSWLLKIAENVCKSSRHDSKRRFALEIAEDPEALGQVAAPPNPEVELLMPLEDALGRLTDSQRQALLLREWRGLSYREIADRLGTGQGAVEVLLFRARRALAEELESPGTVRRRRVRGLDLAGLAGLVKQLLGGGTTLAVKSVLAAIAVAAAATVTTVAVSLDADDPGRRPGAPTVRPKAEVPAPPPPAVAPSDSRRPSVARGGAARTEKPVEAVPAEASPPQTSVQEAPAQVGEQRAAEPRDEPSPVPARPLAESADPAVVEVPTDVLTGAVSSTLDPVVDTTTAAVSSVSEAADELTGAVVATAEETVTTVTTITAELPEPTLPALPLPLP